MPPTKKRTCGVYGISLKISDLCGLVHQDQRRQRPLRLSPPLRVPASPPLLRLSPGRLAGDQVGDRASPQPPFPASSFPTSRPKNSGRTAITGHAAVPDLSLNWVGRAGALFLAKISLLFSESSIFVSIFTPSVRNRGTANQHRLQFCLLPSRRRAGSHEVSGAAGGGNELGHRRSGREHGDGAPASHPVVNCCRSEMRAGAAPVGGVGARTGWGRTGPRWWDVEGPRGCEVEGTAPASRAERREGAGGAGEAHRKKTVQFQDEFGAASGVVAPSSRKTT
jgi:hypothetical protein